jgi:hypothetical protein
MTAWFLIRFVTAPGFHPYYHTRGVSPNNRSIATLRFNHASPCFATETGYSSANSSQFSPFNGPVSQWQEGFPHRNSVNVFTHGWLGVLHLQDVADATGPGRWVTLPPANRKNSHGEPMPATDPRADNTSASQRSNKLARSGETYTRTEYARRPRPLATSVI